ncbi:MAG: hypothetical protein IJ154_06145 [Bacteroidales bacterium]|nr:hypothetical protein [Bacteroidales bacterium]
MSKYTFLSLEDEFQFGKHQGSSLNMIIEFDPGYLVWCLENINRLSFSFDLIEEIKDKYPDFPGIDLLDQHGYEPIHEDDNDEYDNYYYGEHYGEYAGTYVQDVMGWSDERIGDALDGEPDAYWNID